MFHDQASAGRRNPVYGTKTMIVENRSTTPVGEIAMEEVEAALATAPNNSLLGSSSIRIPFPMGLWIYNGFVKYEKGFGRWIFNRLPQNRY